MGCFLTMFMGTCYWVVVAEFAGRCTRCCRQPLLLGLGGVACAADVGVEAGDSSYLRSRPQSAGAETGADNSGGRFYRCLCCGLQPQLANSQVFSARIILILLAGN